MTMSCSILHEDDFDLEFHTANGLDSIAEGARAAHIEDCEGYVLHERIILPPDQLGQMDKFSAQSFVPHRANSPLIFIGHPFLPVQYSSIVLRANPEKVSIENSKSSIQMQTEGINLFFSAPIGLGSIESDRGFKSAFDRIGELLNNGGMRESAIARTWLYMEDILRDYEKLNQARQDFFKSWFSPSNHFLPASTGIQGRMSGDRVFSIEFVAFSGEHLSIQQLSSPLQNEPTDYGKLFSRAVRVRLPKNDLVFISGTASIDKTGSSVYLEDFERQMAFTLDVLSTLLREVGGDFSNTVQAMIYLKRGGDFDDCLRLLEEMGFPRARGLFQLDVDVCRDDLLCEIELTAVIPR